jgi:hypothetical protein
LASHGSPITGITSQLFRALAGEGQITRGQFFGNTTDTTKVTLIGRDPDSGTRLTTLAETGYGSQTGVVQYYPYNGATVISAYNTAGAPQVITSLAKVPASTVDGVPVGLGNGGYNSGGNVGKAMTSATSAAIGDLVTYVGASDAGNSMAPANSVTPPHSLTYNGVAPSATNIKNGLYTFWGYEHVYYRGGSSVASIVDTIAADIAAEPTPSLSGSQDIPPSIALGDMQVQRGADGGTVE